MRRMAGGGYPAKKKKKPPPPPPPHLPVYSGSVLSCCWLDKSREGRQRVGVLVQQDSTRAALCLVRRL